MGPKSMVTIRHSDVQTILESRNDSVSLTEELAFHIVKGPRARLYNPFKNAPHTLTMSPRQFFQLLMTAQLACSDSDGPRLLVQGFKL